MPRDSARLRLNSEPILLSTLIPHNYSYSARATLQDECATLSACHGPAQLPQGKPHPCSPPRPLLANPVRSQSTLVSLSQVISFHSHLNQLNASGYAPHAPRKLVRQLRTDAAQYDQLCDQIEQRVVSSLPLPFSI